MKRLNNKGYMLVEIILASVLAMVVTYFLTDLTIKLKNKNDDLLVKTLVATDQAIIYNTIMKDLYNDSSTFSCDNITIDIDNNKFMYKNNTTGVYFTNIVTEYVILGPKSCDATGVTIPISVPQLPDENFNVEIKF